MMSMTHRVEEVMWVARIQPSRVDPPVSEKPGTDPGGEVATIRRASVTDLPQLLEMMREFNRDEGIEWHPLRCELALRRLLEERELGVVGIAVSESGAHGYFVVTWGYDLEFGGRDAWLTEIYVRDDARRRGIGRGLLDAAEAQARAGDARALHLTVRPDNTPARALYGRAGYFQNPRHFLSKSF